MDCPPQLALWGNHTSEKYWPSSLACDFSTFQLVSSKESQ